MYYFARYSADLVMFRFNFAISFAVRIRWIRSIILRDFLFVFTGNKFIILSPILLVIIVDAYFHTATHIL